ncbi:AAA family ATPase [Luteolibacter yonseiensis]|uniref:AAA family ATPase n=1 Tax=Luteolibacter yonseiensis TaxID=1144680 RepID=A0A934QZU7_9BACT|nr:AAA family ATPase [Luteolibacter yonseiensis]MBK1814124.1 AAA family ATPase [Luteolibacter yonseiensis]
MKTLAFFNNKGGVGKTTLVYHLAWMFADMGKRVLVADLDPQANVTSMFLEESELEKLWDPDVDSKQSIMAPISPLIRGLGDIGPAPVRSISSRLRLIPGDLNLSSFESKLSEAWIKCLDRDEAAFRITSAFHRLIRIAARDFDADIILIDVGPNFGAINRSALICADAVVVPLAPDLFSIQGLMNLGPTLRRWREEWLERRSKNPEKSLDLPIGNMTPLGYVILQFGIRDSRPVKAYDKWSQRIPEVFSKSVLGDGEQLSLDDSSGHCLGLLKHYRSLMPMAMEARKPIFHLKAADGAIGAHSSSVKDCEKDFSKLADAILSGF